MELLTIILLIIIGILAFLLLKKERVLGIKTDENKTEEQVKVIESKDYRKNIYDLLNYIPEGIIILDKSKSSAFGLYLIILYPDDKIWSSLIFSSIGSLSM